MNIEKAPVKVGMKLEVRLASSQVLPEKGVAIRFDPESCVDVR